MPINPSIPLGVKPPEIQSPLDTSSKVMQLSNFARQQRNLDQQAENDKLTLESNRLKLRDQQKDMEEDDAIQDAISESGGDWVKAYPIIVGINAGKALKIKNAVTENIKNSADAAKAQHDQLTGKLALIGSLLNSAKTSPESMPVIKSTLKNELGFDDEELAEIPDSIDPANPADVAKIDALISRGLSLKDQLDKAHNDAIDAHNKETDRLKVLEQQPKDLEQWGKTAAQLLGGISTQPAWIAGRNILAKRGAPPEVIAAIPESYSTEAVNTVNQMGLSAKERADLADKNKPSNEYELSWIAAGVDPVAAKQAQQALSLIETSKGGETLTGPALDKIAEMFAMTGQLPALGMAAKSTNIRAAIMNRAAELFPGVQFATNRAVFDANKSSLSKLTGQMDAVKAFENTALANTDVFLEAAKKLVDSGSPILNRPIRDLQNAVLGNAETAAYKAAQRIAINEIARVTSNPNLSGVLSDTARHEVEQLVPEGATIKQIYEVVNTLKKDLANRVKSFDEQKASIEQRIKDMGQNGAANSALPAGKIRVKRKSDGQTGTISESAFDPAKYDRVQ